MVGDGGPDWICECVSECGDEASIWSEEGMVDDTDSFERALEGACLFMCDWTGRLPVSGEVCCFCPW